MLFVVNAALLLCGPARAEAALSAQAGYAFRSHFDGRNHGVAASLGADIPLPGPLALRPEAVVLGFSGSKDTPQTLSFVGGALSLVYRFDDTDVRALLGVGPLAGVSVEGPQTALRAGALLALGLRFPVVPGVSLEAKVSLPVIAYGPAGIVPPAVDRLDDGTPYDFPLQTTFALGFAVDPLALVDELTKTAATDPG